MRSTYIKSLLAAVVMLTMVTSCADNGEEATPEPLALTFYLQTADARTVTRATEGEVDETSGEGTLHTVKAWLFSESEPGVLLDYKEVSSATQMTMSLPQYIVSKREPVALYVLANAESVGLEGLNAATTRDELKQAVMGGSYFQTNPTATVPAEGLPYSCVKRNWVVADEAGENVLPSTQLGTILLTRAVSKIRFAFARTTGLDDVEVTGLQLDGALLPTSQYVFPIDSVTNAANYATVDNIKYRGDRYPNIKSADGYIGSLTSIYPSGATNAYEGTLVSNANIREYADPTVNTWKSYVAANPSTYNARDYNDLISQVQQGKYDLTYYFRETDKPLTGVIYYKIGGQNKSTKFSMPAANAGDFTRNHIWIVYGYFQGNKLEVRPIVQKWDWEENHQTTFLSRGSIDISIFGDEGKQSYKLYNPTPKTPAYAGDTDINWNNSYVGLFYGIEKDDPNEHGINGQPLYSPMIHLKTCYEQDLTLYLTNTAEFGFVKVTIDESTGYRSYEPAYNAISNPNPTPLNSITIPKATTAEKTDTYFFVVPRNQYSDATIDVNNLPDARKCRLYLLDDDGMKQPINPSFMPGPDNIEIWFFYMGSLAAFNALPDYTM